MGIKHTKKVIASFKKWQERTKQYERLLLIAKAFVIDARGSWETQIGDYLVEEIDKFNLEKK